MAESLQYAFECIVWYNCHYEWLEELADQLEATEPGQLFRNPLEVSEWHTEKHFVWMLLVGMFGNWGTSIRSGWIEQTTEAAEYIRKLCKKARGEIDDQAEDQTASGKKD